MGWATPMRIERVLGEVRSRWPDMPIALHLHDTRGLAVANAHAGLKMGVTQFDSTVGGLGGCPFAGQPKAAGNICTEELVLLCEEMGIDTGVDLDALIEVGRMAEEIVGHQLAGRTDPRRQPRRVPPAGRGLMSARAAGGPQGPRVQPHGHGADRRAGLRRARRRRGQGRAGAEGRPHARPRRLRRRVLRRLQPQQAQPRGRSEAAGGAGGDPPPGADRRCRARELRPRHDGAARLRL